MSVKGLKRGVQRASQCNPVPRPDKAYARGGKVARASPSPAPGITATAAPFRA